ncbi:MAG: MFS transporter [Pseudomonadota bacterium]
MSQPPPITYKKIAAYGLFQGLGAYAVVGYSPMTMFVTGVVATQYGFDLVTLGVMLSFLTILDMIWDPAIGRLSDTRKTRFGQRRPWIIAGAILTTAVGLVLFYPRDMMSIWYFVVLYGLLNLTGSMFQVPMQAMGTAITRDYRSRDKLYMTLPIFVLTIGGGFNLLPQLPIFETTRLTVEVLALSICIFGLLSLPAIWVMFRSFPEEEYFAIQPKAEKEGVKENFRQIWHLLKENKPFLFYIVVQTVGGIGTAAMGGLMFFWFDGYLGIGDAFTQIGLGFVIIGLIAPIIGVQITKFISRRKLFVIGTLLSSINGLVMFFLTPGTPYVLEIFIFSNVVFSGIITVILGAVTFGILADVVDYGRFKTRQEGAGLYISTNLIIRKAQTAVLGGAGIAIVGYFGFVAGADTQTEEASMALRVMVAGLPFLSSLFIGIAMWWFPLTKRRMEIIAKRLNQRAERSQRNSPVEGGNSAIASTHPATAEPAIES